MDVAIDAPLRPLHAQKDVEKTGTALSIRFSLLFTDNYVGGRFIKGSYIIQSTDLIKIVIIEMG